jgi:hypothetical protein
MDDLEAKAKSNKNTLLSIGNSSVTGTGSAGVKSGSGEASTVTSFSRLKSDFLYKGEAAAVADEFEKRTGMKRDEFLMHLGSATDARLNFDDPQLMSKLEQRFQAFKARVTNKEFRAGLDKAESFFPQPVREKLLGEIQSFYVNSWKNDKPGGTALASAAAIPPSNESVADNAPSTTAAPDADNTKETPKFRTLASESKPTPASGEKLGLFIGLNNNSDALKDLFQSAGIDADEDSIFKIVSLRYRKLAPVLIGKAKAIR